MLCLEMGSPQGAVEADRRGRFCAPNLWKLWGKLVLCPGAVPQACLLQFCLCDFVMAVPTKWHPSM